MEEAPVNGGLLYHEVQEAKLCAVHCVNTVLQGPFFSELDLAAIAADLDQTERQMMLGGVGEGGGGGDFLSEDSHNVSVGGDFSIQVLQKALEIWDLLVIPLNSPEAEQSKHEPELENAYICHLLDHWFTIRKVNGEWYNFNSLYPAPEHLSKFYLSAYLDTLKGSGWSIFLVRGNFPRECPMSSLENSTSFGQWLTPDDAKRITKSCNQNNLSTERTQFSSEFLDDADIMAQEEEDLNAAIAASLMDSGFQVEPVPSENNKPKDVETAVAEPGQDTNIQEPHQTGGAENSESNKEPHQPGGAETTESNSNIGDSASPNKEKHIPGGQS